MTHEWLAKRRVKGHRSSGGQNSYTWNPPQIKQPVAPYPPTTTISAGMNLGASVCPAGSSVSNRD
jgi:hypothetical protein